jgi:hypothetical protein
VDAALYDAFVLPEYQQPAILILAHSVGKTHIFTGFFDPKVSKFALFSGEIMKFFHPKVQN